MIKNAEFLLEGGRTGVLLIHGLTGTPTEMRVLGLGLHRAGMTVLGMGSSITIAPTIARNRPWMAGKKCSHFWKKTSRRDLDSSTIKGDSQCVP